MSADGTPFKGVLYPGLFVTDDGPRVIEFNARFGDPEAEALLPRLETDLIDIMLAVIAGTLDGVDVRWSANASLTVKGLTTGDVHLSMYLGPDGWQLRVGEWHLRMVSNELTGEK